MTSNKKRSRSDVDVTRADCPFAAKIFDEDIEAKRRRKSSALNDENNGLSRRLSQLFPFAPTGKFKTYDKLDVTYLVEPTKRWMDMTRYNSFVLNGIKYSSKSFVYVANDASIRNRESGGTKTFEKDWVARILEIRASDKHHVYARVCWMYWPDELPEHTMDGKKYSTGRQPYHAASELVASNHMDVINVVSVTQPAQVNHMIENDGEETQGTLYWRQALDVRMNELSSVETICKCGQPVNPDKTLIGCSKGNCGKWLHQDCIIHDALMKTWERLGSQKPHIVKEEEEARQPSPTERNVAAVPQSVDVKADGATKSHGGSGGDMKPHSVELSNSYVAASETHVSSRRTASATPNPMPSNLQKAGAHRGGKQRGVRRKRNKPYEGLLMAKTRIDLILSAIEITDLRSDIDGGEKFWEESMYCLICNKPIV